jgi:hypothetical protein
MRTSSGLVYETRYDSGQPSDSCGQYHGGPAPGDVLSQYGAKACAEIGKVWYDILLNWYYFSPASVLRNGPHATVPGEPSLPLLVPTMAPHSTTQVRITFSGEPGVIYYRCTSSLYPPIAAACTSIGTGISTIYASVPAGDDGVSYVRVRACKNGYCSAVVGGGVRYRSVSGNRFYATASYIWPYAQAHVGARNLATQSTKMNLYDGAFGFGGQLQHQCWPLSPGSNCGPVNWFPDSASYWFATGVQSMGGDVTALIRVVPTSSGE